MNTAIPANLFRPDASYCVLNAMRTRFLLLAVLMLTAACRLSDRQQVGVLKFAATTIANATTQSTVAPATPAPAARPASMSCRMQKIHMRVRRVMTRVIRFEVIASERTCPKARPAAVRS